jgi:hypothetical protein
MTYRRNPIYDTAYERYLMGLSLDQVAKELNVTRQCVFKAFKKRGFALRSRHVITAAGYEALRCKRNANKIGKISKVDKVGKVDKNCLSERFFRKFQIYDGIKFSLRNNGYYAKTNGDRMLMHRYVWEKERGKIPKGWDIHHINENKEDNRIENLECLPKAEHTKKYSPFNNQYTKGRKICKL